MLQYKYDRMIDVLGVVDLLNWQVKMESSASQSRQFYPTKPTKNLRTSDIKKRGMICCE